MNARAMTFSGHIIAYSSVALAVVLEGENESLGTRLLLSVVCLLTLEELGMMWDSAHLSFFPDIFCLEVSLGFQFLQLVLQVSYLLIEVL